MSTRTAIRGRLARAMALLAAGAAIAMPATAANAAVVHGSGGVTPSISRCPDPGQQFANPGFEAGKVTWTGSPGVIWQTGHGEPAHSGSWLAWLDGYGTKHTDSLAQSSYVPYGCTGTLSFWLYVDTSESTTTTAFDALTVAVNGVTKSTYSNLDDHNAFVHVSIVLTGVTGPAAVTFTGTEDETVQTSFVIDDTAFTLS